MKLRYLYIKCKPWLGYVAAIITTILALHKFNEFGGLRFEQILFFIVLPFTLTKTGGLNKVTPLFLISAFLLLMFYATHVYSILFIGVCFAIFVSLVVSHYRPTLLSIILAIICTPAIKYLLSIFSFPLRLKLTEIAGKILMPLTDNLNIQGNCIFLDGVEVSIAPECLGLNMISSALVFAIFTLSFFSGKFKQYPKPFFVLTFLLYALALVIFANLTRIILTVLLQAMPQTYLHEAIGILLFVINCCIPLFIIGAYSKSKYKNHRTVIKNFAQQHYLSLAIAPLLIIGSYDIHENSFQTEFKPSSVSISGFTQSTSTDGVIKFKNDSALIYIKPPAFLLGSDHNPFICWRASGYKIKNETEQRIGNNSVYLFKLCKPNEEPLYSCWWYSNGQSHTISQLKWRLASLKGDNAYSVVNVTSNNQHKTLIWVKKILTQNIFKNQR